LKLPSAALAAAELAINRALDKRGLAPLGGSVLKLQSQDGCLFVLVEEGCLHLKADWQGRVDCCLTAPLPAWLALLRSSDKAACVQAEPFICEGNIDLPLQLLHILQSQPLNLAHELSERIGPLPAALLESAAKRTRQFAQYASENLQQSLAAYLSTETALLPSHQEAQARFAEIADLTQRLDALERRISRL